MDQIIKKLQQSFIKQLKDFSKKLEKLDFDGYRTKLDKTKIIVRGGANTDRRQKKLKEVQQVQTIKSNKFTPQIKDKQLAPQKLDELELFRQSIKQQINQKESQTHRDQNMIKLHNEIFYDEEAARKAYELTRKMHKQRIEMEYQKKLDKQKTSKKLDNFLSQFHDKIEKNLKFQHMSRIEEFTKKSENRYKTKVVNQYKQQKSKEFVRELHRQYNIPNYEKQQQQKNQIIDQNLSRQKQQDLQSQYSQILHDISHDKSMPKNEIDYGFIYDQGKSSMKQSRTPRKFSNEPITILPSIQKPQQYKQGQKPIKARIPSNHIDNNMHDYDYIF